MSATPSPAAFDRAQLASRDGSTLRVVGRARLQVDHADRAWAAQQALEDGLNTADFADCGRLIVVRSLQLRGLEPGARGPAFARAIEAAWRALAPLAQAFDAPGAVAAPAVYFRSATAARLAWLQRVAEPQPVDAWFWRAALPELAAAPPATADAAVAEVCARLLRDDPQALATALRHWPVPVVRRLLAGRPMPLNGAGARWPVGALPPALAAARQALVREGLVRAGRVRAGPEPIENNTPPHASARAEPAELIAWLASLELQDDAPLAALATLMLAPGEPSSVAIEQVAAVVVQAQAQSARRWVEAVRSRPVDATRATPIAAVVSVAARAADRGFGNAADEHAPQATSRQPTPLPINALPAVARGPAGHRTGIARWPWLADNEPTAHGGLLMLLNLLRALGFDAWLAIRAPAERPPLVALLFETLADRLRMPADDPHRVLFAAAEPWRGDAAARSAVTPWVRQLRRTLRLQAHVGLASVVRRDAGIAITTTHIDVVMPLHSADLRLRRAGLDSDPGWLPWFGWIVKLHYVAAD